MLASTFSYFAEGFSIHCVYEVKNTFTMGDKYSVGCRATIKKRNGRDFTIESFDKKEVDAWDVTKPDTSPWFKENKGKRPENQLAEYVMFDKQENINIPEGITMSFEFAKTFIFNNGGLKRLFKHDLKQFPAVERFDFEFNKLEMLEADTFGFNPNLQSLSLKGNQIRFVSAAVGLDNMKYFIHFNMAGNVCINEDKNCMVTRSAVGDCKVFVKKVIEACPAAEGFDMDMIRAEQWEQGRRIVELTELETSVKIFERVLEGIAGSLKPNGTM